MEDDELQVYLKWTLHSIDLLYTAIECMITFVVQWDAHSPEVSMNIWTAKVCIPWFATLSSKFPAEHLSLLLEWFTPFLLPLFLLYSIFVSSFYSSINIVVLYQFTVTCIAIWSVRSLGRIMSSRLWLFFDNVPENIACSRPSTIIWTPGTGYREERNGFVKADDHLHFFQFMLGLHFAPGLHFTLSLQSAFYTLSGILPLICSEQSAVCILHWLVFHLYSIYRYFSICYVIKTFFY